MIDKLTYDQILNTSKELASLSKVIFQLLENRDIPELNDFAATVEGYSKFLENTVQLYKDADNAVKDLAIMNKKSL